MNLPTTDTIIFTSSTDGYYTFIFQNQINSYSQLNMENYDCGIAPLVTVRFDISVDSGTQIIASADTINSIDYSILDSGGTNITPTPVSVPSINTDTLQQRSDAWDKAIAYLAAQVTTANITNFIQTFRNQSVDYRSGLDTLQSAITASASSYLTAQRKSDLINILTI